jgi:hypothetical protein
MNGAHQLAQSTTLDLAANAATVSSSLWRARKM